MEDQAEACGTACGSTQAANALSCSQPKRRTFHKTGERVDVLIAQFLLNNIAGQALGRSSNTAGGRFSLHKVEERCSYHAVGFQAGGGGITKGSSNNIALYKVYSVPMATIIMQGKPFSTKLCRSLLLRLCGKLEPLAVQLFADTTEFRSQADRRKCIHRLQDQFDNGTLKLSSEPNDRKRTKFLKRSHRFGGLSIRREL